METVLISGKIVTMNSKQSVAEAIAIGGDRILKVGTNDEIAQLIDDTTDVVDLKGRTVVPGFIDAHVHVLDFGKTLQWLELTAVKSIRELQAVIRERTATCPSGKWIVGRGWDENYFQEKRMPAASDLDSASPDNPVILYHATSMVCIVNSRALRIAGITKLTQSPKDGVIGKDANGEPTGILEGSATNLAWKSIPSPNENELSEMAILALEKIAEAGIATVHWIVLSASEISVAKKLQTQNRLPVRVFLVVPAQLIIKASVLKSDKDSMLYLGGGMIVTDGYLAARTAALTQPYTDEASNSGKMICSKKEIASEIHRVVNSGFQPVVQAMGDKAIEVSLMAIENASKGLPQMKFPIRVEQPALLNPSIIERMKGQKIVASVQPCVVASEFTVWKALEHLGTKRVRWLYPLKTLSEAGLQVVGGSDCPMEPLNPLMGIQTAVTSDFNPSEQISMWEAMRMYTINAAYATEEETLKGSIEEGKLADLTVLSADPFSVVPKDISNITVEMTIVGGKTVFSRASAPVTGPQL